MANTYYDSELTAEEIEAALEAIIGLIVPANNGKVIAINNGKFEARSVQWGGGEPILEPLNVTTNGDYYPEAGVDGFDEVHVSVPNSYTSSDEGKVVNNGALIAQTARTTQITENGTYDTTLNDEVTVNVSGGGSAVVQPLSVTQNGTYNPPSGVDGYAPVTVNVSGGSSGIMDGIIWEQGAISANYSNSYDNCKTSSTTRIRTDTLVRINTQGIYNIDFNDNFDVVIDLFSSGCEMVDGGAGYNAFRTQPFSINITNRNVAFVVRKKSGATITPEEISDVNFSVTLQT